MNRTILKTTCPHCNEALQLIKPDKPGRYGYKCPKCEGKFAVNCEAVTSQRQERSGNIEPDKPKPAESPKPDSSKDSPTKINEGGQYIQTYAVHRVRRKELALFRSRRFKSDEELELHVGNNVIGTKSKDAPSDIMISDSFMSRRSVSIEVQRVANNAYKYLFTLLRSSNPAYINGKKIGVGTSFFLKEDDTFVIGKTTFYMKAK